MGLKTLFHPHLFKLVCTCFRSNRTLITSFVLRTREKKKRKRNTCFELHMHTVLDNLENELYCLFIFLSDCPIFQFVKAHFIIMMRVEEKKHTDVDPQWSYFSVILNKCYQHLLNAFNAISTLWSITFYNSWKTRFSRNDWLLFSISH